MTPIQKVAHGHKNVGSEFSRTIRRFCSCRSISDLEESPSASPLGAVGVFTLQRFTPPLPALRCLPNRPLHAL